MKKLSLEDIVREVEDVPALPEVTFQALKLADDPNSTAQDMNAVITKDQSLTAKVLKLANSAYYGFPRRIYTVTEATVLLGFSTIKGIVMAASVSDMMSKEITGYALAPGELWRHSQASAMAARYIARNIKAKNPDVAYTGALLHDVGKVVLNHHLEEGYHEVLQVIQGGVTSFIEAEQEVLGFTHAEVGARLARKWNLPEELVESILYHHTPEKATLNPVLTSLVHLADALCMMMGIGLGVDGLVYQFSEEALRILNLTPDKLESMLSSLTDILVDENSFLG